MKWPFVWRSAYESKCCEVEMLYALMDCAKAHTETRAAVPPYQIVIRQPDFRRLPCS